MTTAKRSPCCYLVNADSVTCAEGTGSGASVQWFWLDVSVTFITTPQNLFCDLGLWKGGGVVIINDGGWDQ